MNYREILKDMIYELNRNGISYKLFNHKYDAYKFYDGIRKYMFLFENYDLALKQSSYRHRYVVYLSINKKTARQLLPFEFQPFTSKSDCNEYWVIRNLTKPEYLHISGLPDGMKDSHDWIKEKCEEILGYEVEIEIYKSENAGWIAKLRRKEDAV